MIDIMRGAERPGADRRDHAPGRIPLPLAAGFDLRGAVRPERNLRNAIATAMSLTTPTSTRLSNTACAWRASIPERNLVEAVELSGHPWFVGVQFHPEFKSRPNRPHPAVCRPGGRGHSPRSEEEDMLEKIIILDFGGQYNQLIARRVREMGVYCEILPYSAPMEMWADESLRGMILTGGPNSVYAQEAPRAGVGDLRPGRAGAGHLLRNAADQLHSSAVRSSTRRSANTATPMLCAGYGALFEGVQRETAVFMNHTDRVARCPRDFAATRTRKTARWPLSPARSGAFTACSSTPRCATPWKAHDFAKFCAWRVRLQGRLSCRGHD